MNAPGPVVLANDRQLQRGAHVAGLFLVVWGGMFGGIPLAIVLLAGPPPGDGRWIIPLFILIGSAAFFTGLYLVLARKEVWLDASRSSIEEHASFLGSATTISHARRLFDRVGLTAETDQKRNTSYKIALRGAGGTEVSLGEFSERSEALTAGMRAARAAGFTFEEKRGAGTSLRLAPEELATVPAAQSPEESPWWQQPSAVALVAANLVPLAGVLFLDWHILSVMLLFWLENVIVGLFNIAKILLAEGVPDDSGAAPSGPLAKTPNVFVAAFFTIHYGMFCAGHGIFLISMFGRGEARVGRTLDFPDLPVVVFDLVSRHGLFLAVIALAVSHGVSFYTHYLKPRAYEDADPGKTMFDPYKRVVILHVVILAGGFAAATFGASIAPLLLLIVLKTIVDLNSHRREHAVPYEREMRDFMAEHGHKFVRTEEPAARIVESSSQPLSRFIGTWRADPQSAVPQGWIARAEFHGAGSAVKARLWSQAAGGFSDEGEFDAEVRGHGARVDSIEVRQHAGGRVRIARFTVSEVGENRIDLNEIQHPEGNPKAMQAKSLTLSCG